MGNRKRSGSKKGNQEKKIKLHAARKEFTRAKALFELASGADFNETKFTKHANYHVREKAWKLAGEMVPETEAERLELCEVLSKGRTAAGKLAIEVRLGLTSNDLVEEVAA